MLRKLFLHKAPFVMATPIVGGALFLAAIGSVPHAHAEGPVFEATPAALPQLPDSPQPMPQQDRKEGAGAAAAMAAVGAAMAGASCMMLLRQAAEEQDPSTKAMLRSMAMDQCAQAAESAANAGENDGNKQQLSAYTDNKVDLPYMPKTETFGKKEEAPQTGSGNDTPSDSDSRQVVDAENFQDPLPEIFDYTKPQRNNTSGSTNRLGGSGFQGESISQLKPLGQNQIEFDESSRGDRATPGLPQGPTQMMGANVGGFSNDALRALASAKEEDSHPDARAKRKARAEKALNELAAVTASDGGSNSSASAGAPDMSGILSRFMGGEKEGEESSIAYQLPDLTHARTPNQTGLPNIFQYAGYRIRKSHKEGDLRQVPSTVALVQ